MMSFQGKYEIVTVLRDGESQSFRARQVSTGRTVILHNLAGGQTPLDQPDLTLLIFRFLRSASAEKSRQLLDMGDDEGHIFVVTEDVPECQDLRQWLQSGLEAGAEKEGDVQPAGQLPSSLNLNSTRAFTADALRQAWSLRASAPAPPSPEPLSAPPLPQESPGALVPPAENPSASSSGVDIGPTNVIGFWEKASPADLAGQPAPAPPPTALESSEDSSEVPEVTLEFSPVRPPLSAGDAPTQAMTPPHARADHREQAPAAVAGPPEAKGGAGHFADLVLTPPELMKPSGAANVGEVSISPPEPARAPVAHGPGTKILRDFTEQMLEHDKAHEQAGTSASTPSVDDKPEGEVKSAEKGARPQIPGGFEVVFQSNKPRPRPVMPDLPDPSGNVAASTPGGPRVAPEGSAPPPSAARLPNVAPPVVRSPAEKSSPALGSLQAPREPRQAVGGKAEPSAPPAPPDINASLKESQVVTTVVPEPPVPPVSPPTRTSPSRAQPGEYTRMIANMQAVAGPTPVGPLETPPAGYRPAAKPAAAPARASSPNVPVPQPLPYPDRSLQFQPSPYVASDLPLPSQVKKRKVWVPILILSCLFFMTVALLVFFAFKH